MTVTFLNVCVANMFALLTGTFGLCHCRPKAMPLHEITDLYLYVGSAIRQARRTKKLTQAGLASAVGLTRTSISNIEKGRQKLLLHTFYEISEVLNADPIQLLPPRMARVGKDTKLELPQGLLQRERAFIEAGIGIKKRR